MPTERNVAVGVAAAAVLGALGVVVRAYSRVKDRPGRDGLPRDGTFSLDAFLEAIRDPFGDGRDPAIDRDQMDPDDVGDLQSRFERLIASMCCEVDDLRNPPAPLGAGPPIEPSPTDIIKSHSSKVRTLFSCLPRPSPGVSVAEEERKLLMSICHLPAPDLVTLAQEPSPMLAELLRHVLRTTQVERRIIRQPWTNAQRRTLWNALLARVSYTATDFELDSRRLPEKLRQDIDTIKKDIPRTPKRCSSERFDDDASKALFHVLSSYASHMPRVGYTQGMNMVAAVLLEVTEFARGGNEAYELLMGLSRSLDLGSLWMPTFPRMALLMFQLDLLLKERVPVFRETLETHGIFVTQFSLEWFLTLYMGVVPYDAAVRILDLVATRGWPFVLAFAVVLCEFFSSEMLPEYGDHECLQMLKLGPRHALSSRPELIEEWLSAAARHEARIYPHWLKSSQDAFVRTVRQGKRQATRENGDTSSPRASARRRVPRRL